MRLLHKIAIFQTVKSKVIISLFETVRLSVSISLRNLYNSLISIKEKQIYVSTAKILFDVVKPDYLPVQVLIGFQDLRFYLKLNHLQIGQY